MKTKMITLTIMAFALATSCKCPNNAQKIQSTRDIVRQEINMDVVDNFTIKNASLSGKILNITVVAQGSKCDHDFDLQWNGSVMKSLPPKAMVVLIDKNECSKLKGESEIQLSYDLSMMLPLTNEKIIVMLKGYEGSFELLKDTK